MLRGLKNIVLINIWHSSKISASVKYDDDDDDDIHDDKFFDLL